MVYYNKLSHTTAICLAVVCCIYISRSTVEAACSPDQSVACIRDSTKVLVDFVNNPQASKIRGLCDSQIQSWNCLNAHQCDVAGAESAYRRTMELCNGNIRRPIDEDCSAGLECVRDAANVLNNFVRNPQYNVATMRRLCNTQRDMGTCLRANNCHIEGFEETYRRMMQQCNNFFSGGYPDGSSNATRRSKRALAFSGGIVQPLYESTSEVLLHYRGEA